MISDLHKKKNSTLVFGSAHRWERFHFDHSIFIWMNISLLSLLLKGFFMLKGHRLSFFNLIVKVTVWVPFLITFIVCKIVHIATTLVDAVVSVIQCFRMTWWSWNIECKDFLNENDHYNNLPYYSFIPTIYLYIVSKISITSRYYWPLVLVPTKCSNDQLNSF